jgi:hypothetical protein
MWNLARVIKAAAKIEIFVGRGFSRDKKVLVPSGVSTPEECGVKYSAAHTLAGFGVVLKFIGPVS